MVRMACRAIFEEPAVIAGGEAPEAQTDEAAATEVQWVQFDTPVQTKSMEFRSMSGAQA